MAQQQLLQPLNNLKDRLCVNRSLKDCQLRAITILNFSNMCMRRLNEFDKFNYTSTEALMINSINHMTLDYYVNACLA